MKYDPAKTCAQAEIAKLAALYGAPLSAEELREKARLEAREMARAEARRNPSPQLELEPPTRG